MTIEIINKEGDSIETYELECNPFEVGQVIHIDVRNHDKEFWGIEELRQSFEVVEIEHYLRSAYLRTKKHLLNFTVSVEVKPVD